MGWVLHCRQRLARRRLGWRRGAHGASPRQSRCQQAGHRAPPQSMSRYNLAGRPGSQMRPRLQQAEKAEAERAAVMAAAAVAGHAAARSQPHSCFARPSRVTSCHPPGAASAPLASNSSAVNAACSGLLMPPGWCEKRRCGEFATVRRWCRSSLPQPAAGGFCVAIDVLRCDCTDSVRAAGEQDHPTAPPDAPRTAPPANRSEDACLTT